MEQFKQKERKSATDLQGAEIWEENDVKAFFPQRPLNAHKGMFGKACIVSRGARLGAAMLSASACLRSGAGYTILRVPQELRTQVAAALPACVVEAFDSLDEGILSSDALALGMGWGVSEELYSLISELLKTYRGTLVLDADALNVLARFGLTILKTKSCKVILTPHPKEFARLCNLSVEAVLQDSLRLAKEFATQYDVTLVLKSNRTVIADGVRTAINTTGSPALAKCGSGDVLSGFLVGTCARGLSPFDAACVSCYVFGRAGEKAEEEFGQYAPTSSDVVSLLPGIIKRIESA